MTANAGAGLLQAGRVGARIRPRRSKGPASPETLRLYAADWTSFETWCATAGQAALPADAATVAAFLSAGKASLSAGALGRRVSAISLKHRQQGFGSPTVNETVKAVLRAARHDASPRRRRGPTPAQMTRMAAACGGDLTGLRDRVLLLLAIAGLGPSVLVGLDVEHLQFAATELTLILDTDGEPTGRVAVPSAADLSVCPVRALRDWLYVSGTQFGPVFRKIDRWGSVEHRRLAAGSIRAIVGRRIPPRLRRSLKTAAP
jgi:hypothetical protein